MLGNVWEWTYSEYSDPYKGSEKKCAFQARRYSLRGDSWYVVPWRVHAAVRSDFYVPDDRDSGVGFRLAQD